jgi:hypothetical protein
MGVRSSQELAQDFPVATTAQLQASNYKFDNLIRAGFLGDFGDVSSGLTWLGTAMDALAETFTLAEPTFTGTAGTTTRYYAAVPNYPLEYGPGAASAANGQYLNFLGGSPPYGYPTASAQPGGADGVRRLYGPHTALDTVTLTSATLDANDYVSIVLPAAKHLAGLLFDVVSSDNAGNFFVVAIGVAPGATAHDKGPTAVVLPDQYYGRVYKLRAHAEIAYDTALSQTVYGSLYRP